MSRELDRLLERIRQHRQAFDRAGLTLRYFSVHREPQLGGAVTAGATVFDRITGLEGVVVAITRENIVVQPPAR